jgi:hypothetical protein
MNDDPHTLHASDTGDLVGYDDYLALAAERDAAESLVSAQHDALVALRNERDAWEHRAEVAERENGEALAMLAFTGEPSSLWQAAAAARAKLDEAVQKARYESDVAAQAMAAKDAAVRELAQEKEGSTEWEEESAAWSRKCLDVQEVCDELRAKLADAVRERVDKIVTIAAHEAALCDLRARLADAEKDKERLDWMADDPPFDGLGDHDLYECWHMVAHENGHEEATQEDKRTAFRRLLDTARTAATAQGEGWKKRTGNAS